MVDELSFAGAPKPALAPIVALRSELSKRDPSYFISELNGIRTHATAALPAQASLPDSDHDCGS
jgi:hypothetical protein